MDNRKNIIINEGDEYAKIMYRENCILNIHVKLLRELLILYEDLLNYNMDIVLCLSGPEGSGKSTSGRILAAFFSWLMGNKLLVDNIHFDLLGYLNSSSKGFKGQVNILDEAKDILDKTRSMSKSNKLFTDYMSKCRFKNQIHIIILPAVHDLDSRISIWRMNFLIHNLKLHYENKNNISGYELKRGYFKLFEKNDDLQKHIINFNKSGKYKLPKEYKFHGRFFNNEPFTDEEMVEYDAKKTKAINLIIDNINNFELNKTDSKLKQQRDKLIKFALDSGLDLNAICNQIGLKPSYIKQHIV